MHSVPRWARERIQIFTGQVESDFALWAQDGSKATSNGGIVVPRNGQPADSYWAKKRKMPYHSSPFRFAGGNIMASSRHVFVGTDVILENAKLFHVRPQEIVDALAKEFGKPIIPVGRNGHQIDFHIDLSQVVILNKKTNRETILLSSATAAVDHFELTTESQGDQTTIFGDRRFPGEFFERFTEGGILANLERSDAVERTLWLREYQKQLENLGYDVQLLPGLQVKDSHVENVLKFYNYTNVVVDSDSVLIPTYGMTPDIVAKKIYEGLGYRVIQMPSSLLTFIWRGGVHCASQVFH